MGRLTTHVLDMAFGKPAAGLAVSLRRAGKHGTALASAVTNADGRLDKPLLEGNAMEAGSFDLVFEAGAYFDRLGLSLPAPKFLDQVRGTIRLRRMSYRTEQAYVDWAKRFILFHDKRHPKEVVDGEPAVWNRDAVARVIAAARERH